ncbi:hypothetical protein [Persephonella sp.]
MFRIFKKLFKSPFLTPGYYHGYVYPREFQVFEQTLQELQERGLLRVKKEETPEGEVFLQITMTDNQYEEPLTIKYERKTNRMYIRNDFAGTYQEYGTDPKTKLEVPTAVYFRILPRENGKGDYFTPEVFTLALTLMALEYAKAAKAFFIIPEEKNFYSTSNAFTLAYSLLRRIFPAFFIKYTHPQHVDDVLFKNQLVKLKLLDEDPTPYFSTEQLLQAIRDELQEGTLKYYENAVKEMEMENRPLTRKEKEAILMMAQIKEASVKDWTANVENVSLKM